MKKTLALACSAAILAAVAVAGCSSTESAPSTSPSDSSSQVSASASPTATAKASASPSPSSAIAAGFPKDLVPVYTDSVPTASSFEDDGQLLTASLTASSSASAEEILAFYTAHFEKLGFTALEGDAVDSTPAKDFARTTDSETETANVSVITREGSSIYTVGANVLPGTAE